MPAKTRTACPDERLSADRAKALCSRLPSGWSMVRGRRLEREYRFPDFKTALAFVDRVGALAEAQGHHPELGLGWGRVKTTLWTHRAGGLTKNDFTMAEQIERLPRTRPARD